MLQRLRTTDARARDAWPWWLLLGVAVCVGVFLRLYQLHSQMLIDDEWHSVRMLIQADYAGIARHFGFADYCIPLTLYYRWLYDHAALSEWQMHLPLLLAGVALLLVAPWLLRKDASPVVLAIWTALLAISPSLVYYSRTARPYALIVLLGVIAIIAFRNWRSGRGDGRVWIALYLVAAALAGWLHLLSLVFVLWPFVYYGIAALRDSLRVQTRAEGLRALLRMVLLGIAVVCILACLLALPLTNDWAALSAKAATDTVTLQSLYRTLLLQWGIANAWLGAVLAALLIAGIVRMWKRDRAFAGLLVSTVVVGTAVICASRPAWIQHAQVLVRYAAPILPFLLLFVAEGLGALLERIGARSAALLASLVIAALAFAGPLPGIMYWPNQFMGHEIFQFDYDARENPYATLLQLGPVPAFFSELAKRPPGSVTLIETPMRAVSTYMPDPWYQQIHRQNVKYALASPVCLAGNWDEYSDAATGDRFHRMVRLGGILDGANYGGDFLVLRLHPWKLPHDMIPLWPDPYPDMVACAGIVAAKLGAPVYRDDQLIVFALSGTSGSSANR